MESQACSLASPGKEATAASQRVCCSRLGQINGVAVCEEASYVHTMFVHFEYLFISRNKFNLDILCNAIILYFS